MKIKRYQAGGIVYTPFFRDSVIQQESQSSGTSQTKEDKEDQLIQKEIINVLKENGLPNDVDYFLSKADAFLKKSQNLGSLFSTGKSTSYDMSDLVRLQSLANRVKHNSNLYTKASDQIVKEGSGSEAAITNTGNLYVVSEDEGVQTISLGTYHKSPDKYRVLTNSELIQLREEQPELAYNGTILTDLSNTVGMKSIVDYVKATIGSFGTNKASNQFDRYTSKQKGQIERGFEQLLGFDAPDGIYKVTGSTTESDQGYSDEKSLDAAINYLYRTLPGNMKNVLKANAAAEGLDPSNPRDVQSLLAMAVVEHTSHSRETKQSLDYDSTASKGAGSKSSNSGQVALPFGPSVQRNMGEIRDNGWVLPGGNVKFNLPTYWYDIRTLDNKATPGLTNALDSYQNLRDHGIVDTRGEVTFGGIPIDQITSQGNEIVVDNSKGMGVAYLPVDINGNIDMQMFSIMTQIQEQIIDDRITDPTKIQEIWESNGFQYDPERKVGIPYGQTLKRFAMQSAYTSTKGQIDRKTLKSDPMLQKIEDDIYGNIVSSYNLDSNNKQKIDDTRWWGTAFQGLLLIPLNDNENSSNVAGGIAYTNKPDADLVKAKQDAARHAGAYNSSTGTYDRVIRGMSSNGITSNSLD